MKTLIIAEAGVNHNGDINQAKKLIDIANECGADLVKFQVLFGMLHGVLLTLCGDNYIELTDKVLRETFHL